MPDDRAAHSQCVLVLQGGGALGAYQAGVFEGMATHGYAPSWLAGISIGAINAALIAGNVPSLRVARLREFWQLVSSGSLDLHIPGIHTVVNEASATRSLFFGVPGFFSPRVPPPMFHPSGSVAATSFYDTTPLRDTLERLVDFDRINSGEVRLSVGAVNVRTGNFAYFDSARQRLDVRHIMASGALPPGFAPVEIDGEWYWDGGLVSNTPLHYVLEQPSPDSPLSFLVFQVDLFSSRGDLPANLGDVSEREKDIRFSSRTRLNTTLELDRQSIGKVVQRLLSKLPRHLLHDADVQALAGLRPKCEDLDIVHLIYRAKQYESQSKDYEFSRQSMRDHWQSGLDDLQSTLRDPRWQRRPRHDGQVHVFDLLPLPPGQAHAVTHDRRRPEMQAFRQTTSAPGEHGTVMSQGPSDLRRTAARASVPLPDAPAGKAGRAPLR